MAAPSGAPAPAPKSPFASKTNIAAVLLFVASLGEWLTDHEFVQQYPDVVGMIGMAVAAIMIILRFLTKEPISLGGGGGGGNGIKVALIICLLVAGSSVALAQGSADGATGVTLRAFSPNTSYLLRITTDAEGKVSDIRRVNPFPVLDINQLPVDEQTDNPTSPIPPGSFRAKLDTTLREINDPENAKRLAVGYAVLLSGSYSNVDAIGDAAAKIRQELVGDLRAWDLWGDVLLAELRKSAQEGKLRTPEQYAEILTVARDALLSASGEASEFGDGKILDLVSKILDLFKNDDGVNLPGILEIVKIVLALL